MLQLNINNPAIIAFINKELIRCLFVGQLVIGITFIKSLNITAQLLKAVLTRDLLNSFFPYHSSIFLKRQMDINTSRIRKRVQRQAAHRHEDRDNHGQQALQTSRFLHVITPFFRFVFIPKHWTPIPHVMTPYV